jgi:hypothetical protein
MFGLRFSRIFPCLQLKTWLPLIDQVLPHVFRSRRHLLASEIRRVASTHPKDKLKRQGRSAKLGQALSQFARFGDLRHREEPLSSEKTELSMAYRFTS